MFSHGLILSRHECLCAMSQKSHLTRVILSTVNYCLFANGDVSIRFNGKDDNVVLEFNFLHIWKVTFCYCVSKMAYPIDTILQTEISSVLGETKEALT